MDSSQTIDLNWEELEEAAQRKHSSVARNFYRFLQNISKFTTCSGDKLTNIIDQRAKVTYCLPEHELHQLMDHLDACRKANIIVHFSERQGTPDIPHSGIMLDFDLKLTNASNVLNERHCQRLTNRITNVLLQDLILSNEEFKTHFFFIAKSQPINLKYGFHILIPGVQVSRGYKKYLIRKLREDKSILNVLVDMNVCGTPKNDKITECLDINSASVPVLFLGSCKRGNTPYNLVATYEIIYNNPDDFPIIQRLTDNDLANYNLVYELSIQLHTKPGLVKSRVYKYHDSLATQIETIADQTANNIINHHELIMYEHDLQTLISDDLEARYLHQILELLNPEYYTDYTKWRNVIFAIANTSDKYKPLVDWFSSKCPKKWIDGGLDKLWNEALAKHNHEHPLTKRSIIYWAKECNPVKFDEIKNNSYFTILTKYVYDYDGDLQHYMVAKIIYTMLSNKFVVDVTHGPSGGTRYCWFEFVLPKKHMTPGEVWKWRKEAEPDELHIYISESLSRVANEVSKYIEMQRQNAENDDAAKYYKELGRAYNISKRRFFNDVFKNAVIKQAQYLFRKRGFIDSLDQNGDLLGVGNGVLQLANLGRPQSILINYFHEWPISLYTKVPYRPFDPKEPWTQLLLNAIADIILEPDARIWIMLYLSTGLFRGLKEALALFWVGGGCNGKTFLLRMVAMVLGDNYATKLNIQLLTSDRESADKPNSAFMRLKKRGYGYFEESNKREILNTARLKEIVNPGDVTGRDLHQRQETFQMTATLVAASNYDFLVDTTDHGTWRRLKHYVSKVRFCSNPTNQYEKQEDPRYIHEYIKDPECQIAFLSILVFFWERLQSEYNGQIKYVPCATLERESEIFRNSQDTLNRFITERIVISPGGETYSMAVVAAKYFEWYSANIDTRKHVVSEMIQELENSALNKFLLWGPNRTRLLNGCRILNIQETLMLNDGESYIGIKEPDYCNSSYIDSNNWWNCQMPKPTCKGKKECIQDDDMDFSESKLRIEATERLLAEELNKLL
jgi:phage/plasmid-associated DNA primase